MIWNQDTYFRANRDWLYFSESYEFNADVSQQHFLTNLVAEWRGVVPRFPTETSCPRSPVAQCTKAQWLRDEARWNSYVRRRCDATDTPVYICDRYACFYLLTLSTLRYLLFALCCLQLHRDLESLDSVNSCSWGLDSLLYC